MSSVVSLDRFRAAKQARIDAAAKDLLRQMRELLKSQFPEMTDRECNAYLAAYFRAQHIQRKQKCPTYLPLFQVP